MASLFCWPEQLPSYDLSDTHWKGAILVDIKLYARTAMLFVATENIAKQSGCML
jgi:hypothetical protein